MSDSPTESLDVELEGHQVFPFLATEPDSGVDELRVTGAGRPLPSVHREGVSPLLEESYLSAMRMFFSIAHDTRTEATRTTRNHTTLVHHRHPGLHETPAVKRRLWPLRRTGSTTSAVSTFLIKMGGSPRVRALATRRRKNRVSYHQRSCHLSGENPPDANDCEGRHVLGG